MVRFRDRTKFVFILFVCMFVSFCFSASFCIASYNLSNKKTEIVIEETKVELTQVKYPQNNIPNGVATQSTIKNSLNSSVSVTARTKTGISHGSGTIIGNDASHYSYIVTCNHVIENAYPNMIVVTFNDQTEVFATFVGGDPKTDVAVLKVEGINHTISETILNNDQIFAGENIYVIGNALGIYGFSVTTGCISQQQERQVTVEDYGTFDVLQTDSAVNNGVSGGGMFDTNGTLVGMISCGYDSSVAQNINFVLPIYKVMDVVKDLLENKDAETGYGYVPGRYSIDLTIATWGDSPSYALVTEVPKNSSFYGTDESTSLMEFDLLKSIQIGDGVIQTISSAPALVDIFNEAKQAGKIDVGTQIKFVACKNSGINNEERNVTITIKQFVFSL